MTRETAGTNIDPSFVQRVSEGVRYIVSGVRPSTFFGPFQPLPPVAQDPAQGAHGRAFDYPVGLNTRIQPRDGEAVSFAQLRGLADGYDLLRLVIETRKDQLQAIDWDIVPIDDSAQSKLSGKADELRQFFKRPSLEYKWGNWLRALLEDLFVLDAVVIYPRMNRGGKLASLDLVDGSTIKRVIDETGRTPLPPDPAYQQILKGMPAVDYTSDELLYEMRNPSTYRLYGRGPVEQIIMTVNIALRRQIGLLQYYTEGNIPDAIAGVPDEWTSDQVTQFQTWWDSVVSGNTAARRHMTFVPLDPNKIKFTKEPQLKDELDEWLARIVCFAFSIPPTAFAKATNRATAETANQTGKEEGLIPLMLWFKDLMDYIIQVYCGGDGLEFRWKSSTNIDPEVAANINTAYATKGVKTIDETREGMGLEKLGGAAGQLMVLISTGYVPIEPAPVAEAPAVPAAPQEPPAPDPDKEAKAEDQKTAKAAAAESRATAKQTADALQKLASYNPQINVKVEPATIQIDNHQPEVKVTVEGSTVTVPERAVAVGDVHVTLPAVPAPVNKALTRTVERDAQGLVTKIVDTEA